MDAATQSESTSSSTSGGEATVTGDAMTTFTGSNFTGTTITCDVLFVPYLEQINTYAKDNNVDIYITSSYREDANVDGAIVGSWCKAGGRLNAPVDVERARRMRAACPPS